jgi:hypothetical protein
VVIVALLSVCAKLAIDARNTMGRLLTWHNEVRTLYR